jgi:hypothetical protein
MPIDFKISNICSPIETANARHKKHSGYCSRRSRKNYACRPYPVPGQVISRKQVMGDLILDSNDLERERV